MKIAYTMAPGRGDTDVLLYSLAEGLAALGYRTCGTVQINTDCDTRLCDMDVLVLPDGPTLRISQNLGREAKGCRLDPAALETAVGLVEKRLDPSIDLLLINKFGKHEADGRGFRAVIAAAIEQDIPVLVGLNRLNAEAFHAFTGGEATEVAPSDEALKHWLEAVTMGQSDVA